MDETVGEGVERLVVDGDCKVQRKCKSASGLDSGVGSR